MSADLLKQAIELIRAGKKFEGDKLLAQLVTEEPNNEAGWLWRAYCAPATCDQVFFLRKALEINPNNVKAKQTLDRLEKVDEPPWDSWTQGGSAFRRNQVNDKGTRTTPPHAQSLSSRDQERQRSRVVQILLAIVIAILGLSLVLREFGMIPIESVIESPCNVILLNQVKNTNTGTVFQTLGKFSEDWIQLTYMDRLKDWSWEVASRDKEGCVVSLVGNLNNVPTELLRFYVDLSDRMITPDNQDTQWIFTVISGGNGVDKFGGIELGEGQY